MDVVRMASPVPDMPAAYAAASVVVSAAIQPEGVQRAILEAQAMARPIVVSDLGAGPDVVLTAPAVPESRIAGLRFHAGDDASVILNAGTEPGNPRAPWTRVGARAFQFRFRYRADAANL
jgi:glycosyltransferase involved in cell wall biosynthesis